MLVSYAADGLRLSGLRNVQAGQLAVRRQ